MNRLRWLRYALVAKRLKLPIQLILFVTGRCNGRCRHCFYWDRMQKDRDMTFDELRNLSESLDKLIMMSVSGGEPFLRKDLPEICSMFRANNDVDSIAVPTNCLLPKRVERMTRAILDDDPRNLTICVSLDGLRDTHDRLRGVKGSFMKTMDACGRLSSLKLEYPNLTFKMNTTVSKANLLEIDALSGYVRREIKPDFHNFELFRGVGRDRSMKPLHGSDLLLASHAIRSAWGRHRGAYIAVKRMVLDTEIESIIKNRNTLECLAGRATAVVYHNGDVAICELMPPVGNLRRDSFASIWESRKMPPPGCYCTHSCFQNSNVMFSPSIYPRILRRMGRKPGHHNAMGYDSEMCSR